MLHMILAASVVLSALGGVVSVDVADGWQIHPSILIENDADFASPFAGVRDGDGSAKDPYVISDLAIIHTHGPGIRIANTRAHVVVEDVTVSGQSSGPAGRAHCSLGDDRGCFPKGIDIENATNVQIRRVVVLDEAVGIRLKDSAGIRIDDSLIRSTVDALSAIGLDLLDSEHVTVSNLTVRGMRWNMILDGMSDGIVVGSDFGPQGGGTMPIGGTYGNVTFRGNHFPNAPLYVVGTARGVRFIENTFEGPASQLIFDSASATSIEDVAVCGNRFRGYSGAFGAALELAGSVRPVVVGNQFSNTTTSLFVDTPDAEITANVFGAASRGSVSVSSTDASIHQNSFAVGHRAVHFTSQATGDVRNNWWGDASGPSGHGAGSGAALAGALMPYDPWLTAAPSIATSCSIPAVPDPAPLVGPVAVEAHVLVGVHAHSTGRGLHYQVKVREGIDVASGTIVLP